ncbi:hypothetical protein I4U23_006480 [Adineta vaga]|nr:hypothetical protein I4U23_006480 [Adineta vaga]
MEKDLIEKCLPQLKEFRFKYQTNADEYVTRLWETFQILFWLDEHQSVIHYNFHMPKILKDWYNFNAHLYTLPYCDEEFHLATTTTCFTNASKYEYQSIKHLNLHVNSKYYSHLLEHFYFPNLDSLTITSTHTSIPFIEFINLSQLKHLTIESDSISSKQLFSQIFLHTINFQSLKLSWRLLTELTQNFSNQRICSILQKQIKSLHLYKRCTFKNEKDDQNPIEKLIEIFSENLEKINIEFLNSLCRS